LEKILSSLQGALTGQVQLAKKCGKAMHHLYFRQSDYSTEDFFDAVFSFLKYKIWLYAKPAGLV
jgi:hypothetical protein